MIRISKNRQRLFFSLSVVSGLVMLFALSINELHFLTSALFGAGMLGFAAYRLQAEKSKYSLQMFSVFTLFFSLLFMVCLTTAGIPQDLASVLLTALSPQILVMIINYIDGFVFREGFEKLSKCYSKKLILQWVLVTGALFLLSGYVPQLVVWPAFGFEVLCAPMALFITLPEIFYQNSYFNERHTDTLSIFYGAMAIGSSLFLGMSAYTVVLASMAVTGLFWNSKDTFEIKSIGWQSIAAASIFVPVGFVPATIGCVIGIGSAKLVNAMVQEEEMPMMKVRD